MSFIFMFINKFLYNAELLIYNYMYIIFVKEIYTQLVYLYYEIFRMCQISLELKIKINNIEYAVY